MEINRVILFFKNIPSRLKYLLFTYAIGVLFFALIRFVFLRSNSDLLTNVPTPILVKSFLVGIRFDTVILSYMLTTPVLLFIISLYVKKKAQNIFYSLIHFLVITLFGIAFLIAFANIPFYQNYRLPINKAALHWSNDIGFSIKMILQDKAFINYMLLFVVTTSIFIFITTFVKQKLLKPQNIRAKNELLFLLVLIPLFAIGMRGRLSYKSPIRWGTAFFSSFEIANQAALNPVFSFFKSAADNTNKPFFDTKLAFNIVQKNIETKKESSINDNVLLNNYNVILLLMESMGSNKTGLYDNGLKLTPNLDSLAQKALFFKNCYSDGIHTFNGLFATLTSFPALPMNKPLEDLRIQIPENHFFKNLKERGYQSFFFTTHDTQFDNMEGFMRKIGIEHIIGEEDFPSKEVLSATGVPDHVLYQKSIAVFDTVKSPFFALILSGSDHAPYAIPENIDFNASGNDQRKDIVSYADWSIGNFLKTAVIKNWFNNTLFVFVGDHGAIVNQEADMYLGMHHTPLIFYAPQIFIPESNDALCGQVDVLPSIAHLLGINFNNNPFAVNLFKESRKALSFTYDEHLIGINQKAFYVSRPYEPNLFLINKEEKYCQVSADSALARELRNFSFATMELARTKLFAGK